MSSVIPIFIGDGEGWEDSLNFFFWGGGSSEKRDGLQILVLLRLASLSALFCF